MLRTRFAICVATTVAAGAFAVAALAVLSDNATAGTVEDARLVCSYLADGYSATEVSAEITANSDLSQESATVFVVESAGSYCPEYGDRVAA